MGGYNGGKKTKTMNAFYVSGIKIDGVNLLIIPPIHVQKSYKTEMSIDFNGKLIRINSFISELIPVTNG